MYPQVTIDARFNGPPGSGNGGYTAGLIASKLDPAPGAVVTLRSPPPLATPLSVRPTTAGVQVYAGEVLVAEAKPDRLDDEPAPPVPYPEAVSASAGYAGFTEHPFPTCYVCGPDRAPGDGLRIFPGPVAAGRAAAGWQVPPDATPVTVWAALDCPGGWAIMGGHPDARPGRPYVLGRIHARIDAVPVPGTQCVVVGEVAQVEGRKADVRTALYAPDGTPLAVARAVWIAI